jgi:hypothetical protein
LIALLLLYWELCTPISYIKEESGRYKIRLFLVGMKLGVPCYEKNITFRVYEKWVPRRIFGRTQEEFSGG